jgi:fructokinase
MSFKVIGIGEVLWDLLPGGPQLGGAPANFACHARALGGHAGVITRIGRDQFGREILDRFQQMGFSDAMVQTDDETPTGTVSVTLNGSGIPHYVIHENVAWDRIEFTAAAARAIGGADAICFGSLAQRNPASRAVIQKLLATAPAAAWRVFDINLRQNYFSREVIEQSLRFASVLKLNDGELPILAQFFALTGSPRQQIERLALMFGLQVVALTRGPAGSLLFQEGQWSDCPSKPIEVVDTVGAGDAFTAALVMGLLCRMPLDEINFRADAVARYVCSRAGATPPLPKELADAFVPFNGSFKTSEFKSRGSSLRTN